MKSSKTRVLASKLWIISVSKICPTYLHFRRYSPLDIPPRLFPMTKAVHPKRPILAAGSQLVDSVFISQIPISLVCLEIRERKPLSSLACPGSLSSSGWGETADLSPNTPACPASRLFQPQMDLGQNGRFSRPPNRSRLRGPTARRPHQHPDEGQPVRSWLSSSHSLWPELHREVTMKNCLFNSQDVVFFWCPGRASTDEL